jgi:hypothetical protein
VQIVESNLQRLGLDRIGPKFVRRLHVTARFDDNLSGLVSRRSASFISVMKRLEPQITTIRGRLSSFFALASFSSGVSSCGYDTGSSWRCGPRGACGDENEGVQDRFVTNDADTLATAL